MSACVVRYVRSTVCREGFWGNGPAAGSKRKQSKRRVVQEEKVGMSRDGKGKVDKAGETLFMCVPGWEVIKDGQQKKIVHTNTVGKQGTGLWIWTWYQCPIFPVAKTAPLERTTMTTRDTDMWAPALMASCIVKPREASSIIEGPLNYKLADLSPNSGSTTNGVRNPKQVSHPDAISYFYPWEEGAGRGFLQDPFRLEGTNSWQGMKYACWRSEATCGSLWHGEWCGVHESKTSENKGAVFLYTRAYSFMIHV